MLGTEIWVRGLGGEWSRGVDTVYLGGGTPSLLEAEEMRGLFGAMRGVFVVEDGAEVTVECAPGQVSGETLRTMREVGVNRLSFGVQSFVDAEAQAAGRLHTAEETRAEVRRVQAAGFGRVALDLIVGLPGQTERSWRESVAAAVGTGAEHVSVYMLEVDEGSRLGRERLRGGTKYGAGELPEDDRVAEWYAMGCSWLEREGLAQYEISNFARAGAESRHNRRYWERRPYVGFGLDAHSMVRRGSGAVRWANAEEMGEYVGAGMGARGFAREVTEVDARAALEETLFLGLRMVEGVEMAAVRREFGAMLDELELEELVEAGLVTRGDRLRLTERGRMVSNEVFERILLPVTA